MNLGKAFKYPFEDKEWASKLGLAALILIVPILNFAVAGYSIEIIRRVMRGDSQPLPSWDELGKKFLDGLLLFLANLIYSLPMLLLLCLPLALILVPAILSGNSNSQDLANALTTAGGISVACLSCLFILYGLAISVIFPCVTILYAREGTFSACFRIREIFAMIGKNAGSFFAAWGVYLGTSIGASIVTGILGGVLFWLPFIPAILGLASGLYTLLVYSHLFGQFATLELASDKPLAVV
ncbi:MAG TPA: DUF4013 domain-containing protein [Anaerolineales bacterium]|nr:DUF4013 domain-containing protein [Anaerolineales bacterium]